MKFDLRLESPIHKSARVMQVASMFDVPPAEKSAVEWYAELPLETKPWAVGLIVGPSGAGKSSAARALFPDRIVGEQSWRRDRSVLDDFPTTMGIKDIVALMSSVGFNTPPSWMRPFDVLSNGEKFRVSIARALAETEGLLVVDEFTSVVDRQVAQVASHCVQKTVRKSARQFVAVTCHYDVVEWLQPDWLFEPHLGTFRWREVTAHPPLSSTSTQSIGRRGRRFGGITI